MIQIILDFLIIYAIFRFRERKSDYDEFFINSFCFAIYGLPRLIDILVRAGISYLSLPYWLLIISYSLFFIIPTILLKYVGEFAWKRAISYGAIVLGVVVINEIVLLIIVKSLTA